MRSFETRSLRYGGGEGQVAAWMLGIGIRRLLDRFRSPILQVDYRLSPSCPGRALEACPRACSRIAQRRRAGGRIALVVPIAVAVAL